MRNCKSRLGAYIWDQRSIRGIKRTDLALMIGCERESVTLIEQNGDDIEGVLPILIEILELDTAVVERRKSQDKNLRRAWLSYCRNRQPPMIIPSRTMPNRCHEIPISVVKAGFDAVESYAKDFARSRNRTVELFVRNHVRFLISPSGEMDINELGYFEPWLDELVEL